MVVVRFDSLPHERKDMLSPFLASTDNHHKKKMNAAVSNSDAKALDWDEFALSAPDDSEFIVRALASEFDTDSLRDSLARDAAADAHIPS